MKYLLSFVGSLLVSQSIYAQTNLSIPIIDMGVASAHKAFHSKQGIKNRRPSVWTRMEYDCNYGTESFPLDAVTIFESVVRGSQASVQDLSIGDVRISNQILYPLEIPFLKSAFYETSSIDKSDFFECLTGISLRRQEFSQMGTDYFSKLIEQIDYLEDELGYDYHINGVKYKCSIIKNVSEFDEIFEKRNQLGWVLSIRGGHALVPAIYLTQNQEETREFQQAALANVNRLKGIEPLANSTRKLETPIFSISFNSYFKDGMCGKAVKFSPTEQENFETPDMRSEIQKSDVTVAGQEVIKLLLDKSQGRRILVDIAGMNLKSREWYFAYVKEQRYKKDSIPILALGVGISGANKKDGEYSNSDAILKQEQNTFLNNRQANLCRQDILDIVQSAGLIGISLEYDKLMGKMAQARYGAAIANSAERRKVVLESIVANICMAVKTAQNIEIWEMLCMSTQFDLFSRYTEVYRAEGDMQQLAKDLYLFFQKPYDIQGSFTAKEIKQFMYGYSPLEIVERLMYKNALKFMKKHFPKSKK